MTMAARRQEPAKANLTPFTMRMPDDILAGLDEWVDELNRGRALGKVTRSDLIRLVLSRAIETRPDLDPRLPSPDDVRPDFAATKDALAHDLDTPKVRR